VFFSARGTRKSSARVRPLFLVPMTFVFVGLFSQAWERVRTQWRVVGGSSLHKTMEEVVRIMSNLAYYFVFPTEPTSCIFL